MRVAQVCSLASRDHDGPASLDPGLYDHETDPHEWHNRAADAEYSAVKTDLAAWITERWAEAAPDPIRASYHRMKTPPEYELYDLQADPHEFRNLADDAEHAATLAELKQRLAAWRTQTNDPLLNADNLGRLKAEIDACLVDGAANKDLLTLTYPDYFGGPSGSP